jgi:hypothetical protein
MSKIALSGDASGTGTFTIASPNSNSNYTLTLPTASGTVLTSGSTANFPAGSVLQVVSATTTTEVSTSTVDTWVSSGLSASITPSSASSRIVIIASQNIGLDGTTGASDAQFNLGIFRNSTLVFGQIGFDDSRANTIVDFVYRAGISYLDSPATTSSVTYTTRGSLRTAGIGILKMQYSSNFSSIILMEIAG